MLGETLRTIVGAQIPIIAITTTIYYSFAGLFMLALAILDGDPTGEIDPNNTFFGSLLLFSGSYFVLFPLTQHGPASIALLLTFALSTTIRIHISHIRSHLRSYVTSGNSIQKPYSE